MKLKKWDRIQIWWEDSMHDDGWKRDDHFGPDDDKWLDHETIGFLLLETKKSLNVVQSKRIAPNKDESVSTDSSMCIPKRAITKIKKLSTGK